MKKTSLNFEFAAPVVAALVLVALSAVTAVAAGPGAEPPNGVVNAAFNSVKVSTVLSLSKFGISNPLAGSPVNISDTDGLSVAGKISTTGSITADGDFTLGGHAKATWGFGDFVDVIGNDYTIPTGQYKTFSESCPPTFEVIACETAWKAGNKLPGRVMKATRGAFGGLNETSCYYQLYNDTAEDAIFSTLLTCYSPSAQFYLMSL